MKGASMMEVAKTDMFSYRSSIYKDVINEIELKKACVEYLKEKGIDYTEEELESAGNINSVAKYMCKTKKVPTKDFNHIVYENMTYTCSNIFLEKLAEDLTDKKIERCFKRIITDINKDVVTAQQFELMKKSGFNVLDYAATRENEKLFFPVLEYDAKNVNLMCIIQYEKETERQYKICSIIINREDNYVTFYINGSMGNFLLSNYLKKKITSSKSFFSILKTFVSSYMRVNFISREFRYKNEREKMFLFCKELNQGMIYDYTKELESEIQSTLERQITRIANRFRKINGNAKIDVSSKKDIYNKIFDTYLGQYITNGYEESDLKQKAIEKGMQCYPTNISFTGQELAKGKAKARKKEVPLAFEKVFYSLSADIETSKRLEEVTIAWFDSKFFEKKREIDVSQTTITISKKYFLIVMKNSVNKNKRMTTCVEKKIREVLE